jgi:hypothetical protein
MPPRKKQGLVGHYRNTWGQNFHAVVARKGDSYEAADSNQGWSSRSEPQHDRSLTVLGHAPIPRSEVMPRKFQTSEHSKENRMKLKTKIKAGKLSANHNTIVR